MSLGTPSCCLAATLPPATSVCAGAARSTSGSVAAGPGTWETRHWSARGRPAAHGLLKHPPSAESSSPMCRAASRLAPDSARARTARVTPPAPSPKSAAPNPTSALGLRGDRTAARESKRTCVCAQHGIGARGGWHRRGRIYRVRDQECGHQAQSAPEDRCRVPSPLYGRRPSPAPLCLSRT